jgi:hypothetical protein
MVRWLRDAVHFKGAGESLDFFVFSQPGRILVLDPDSFQVILRERRRRTIAPSDHEIGVAGEGGSAKSKEQVPDDVTKLLTAAALLGCGEFLLLVPISVHFLILANRNCGSR